MGEERWRERLHYIVSFSLLHINYIVGAESHPGRTLATNIPSLENEGITWQDFVERLNPKVWEPRNCDMRFYPHKNKHRDGKSSVTATPAGDGAAPATQVTATMTNAPTTETPTTKLNTEAQTNTAHTLQRHQREFRIIFNLLEKLLHPESTKRCTPQTALAHLMLAETATTAPPPPLSDVWAAKIRGNLREGDDAYFPHAFGKGVCGDWHSKDEVTEVECVKVLRKCLCLRGGSCVGGSGSEDGSEMGGPEIRNRQHEDNGWCGQHIEQVVELSPGEGIAIGNMPCEFHEDDIYANYGDTMME